MKKVLLLTLTMILMSCQNEQNQPKSKNGTSNKVTSNQNEHNKNVTIVFDLETSVSEDMKLVSTNIFLNNGQFMDLYITQNFSRNETSKILKFELPIGVMPDYNLGLSFGTKALKEIKINNIKLAFEDQNYDIDSKDVMTFFKTNRFVDYIEQTKTFKTKKVDGKHNPILFLRKPYIDKIQGLN